MWVAVMTRNPGFAENAQYHFYLVGRLLSSLARAERARSARERSVHLRACRIYCELLLVDG